MGSPEIASRLPSSEEAEKKKLQNTVQSKCRTMRPPYPGTSRRIIWRQAFFGLTAREARRPQLRSARQPYLSIWLFVSHTPITTTTTATTKLNYYVKP